ncbi:unnamed protein product, partial [Polarella glacialis]
SGNGYWHIDSSFKVIPALASLLDGRLVPPPGAGGETEFASSRAAFAALPEGQQRELEDLICIHDFVYSLSLDGKDMVSGKQMRKRLPPARHFLVRKTLHGKSIFTGKHCSHIENLDLQEGRALIRELNRHVTSGEFVYRHEWSPGDLVVCDNRSCIHRGRPWSNPGQVKRMICLAKIAEGRNEVAAAYLGRERPGAIGEAAA